MTSATDVLRRLLDERGVEWHDTKIGKGFITVYEHDGITWIVTEHSSGRLSVKGCVKPTQGHYDGMTPEQAIAATLGSCNCPDNCTNGERTETCEADETDLIPFFERYVDERGNISVRVSQDMIVLTQEEAERIEAEYKRMQAENAKLRELLTFYLGCLTKGHVNCDSCAFAEGICGHGRKVIDWARELGVEVDA